MMGKHVIRTSDRIGFKKCRRQYDWSGIDRENWVPLRGAKPLEFGTDCHAGWAAYYDPLTWDLLKSPATRDVVLQNVWAEYMKSHKKHRQKAIDASDYDTLGLEQEDDYAERIILARGMFDNYFEWAPLEDNFTPVEVEVDFEVPILDDKGEHYHCDCHGWPVFYQGRLDGIVQDQFGWYWILEHKTTSVMGDTSHLILDEQTGSYAWAIQHMLGVRVLGILYNEALKKVPHAPPQLVSTRKGRNFSIAKDMDTTYELYLDTITKAGEPIVLYEEILNYLKHQGNKFLRRTPVNRNAEELADIGHRIYLEAQDMLDPDLKIYPNPNRFTCMQCAFRSPCIAKNDGSDYEFLLNADFRQRTSVEISARRARA